MLFFHLNATIFFVFVVKSKKEKEKN